MTAATVERTYDLSFSYFAPLMKAYEKDGEMYIVVKASDTSVDRDNERIAPELINKMRALAKSGQLVLLDHHKATFPMGRSVDVEDNPEDPNGFYPVFKLDPDHPYSRYMFKLMKENTMDFGVSVGGKYPKVRWATTPEGRLVAEVYDAEIDHVAFTRRGYEANPNTGIVRAIFKAMREVGLWEKEMNDVLNQVTRVVVEQPKQGDEAEEKCRDDDTERKRREEEFKVAKEALSEAVAAVLNSMNPTVTDEQFAKEFQMAVSEAKIINPIVDKVIAAREAEYGYERGVYACTEPPKVWGHTVEFADPVGYFYPLTPNYLKASLNHFLKVGWNYYLPDSAAKVYANLVGAALKAGIPVSYTDNPLLSASLPADLKVNLKDYNPQTDAMCALLWDAYKSQSLRELVGEADDNYLKESREELLEALRERERKYGYKAPLNANLTKPSRWENVPDDEFADPVGYKYPVHTPRNARAALTYFNKPENRTFYTVDGQIKVMTRILQACLRHGIKVSFQPDDPLYWLLPPSLKRKLAGYDDVEDQDTEEKREEMRRKVEQVAASGVEKATLRVLEWAKEVDEERVVTAIDRAGLKVDREVPVAVTDVPTEVKVEDVGQVPVKEKPVEVDIKVAAQKYDITKVEFLVALPVEKFPADLADLNELVGRVRDLGLNFNVVKVDGAKGAVTFKANDDSEVVFVKNTVVGVWQMRGVGTCMLWGLQWCISDALKRRFPERNLVVEDLSVDMAVFRDLDTNQLFAVGWKVDENGYLTLSPVVKEVVLTYELPEDAIGCYEHLKEVLWRPENESHAEAVEGQVAVALEVTPPSPQP